MGNISSGFKWVEDEEYLQILEVVYGNSSFFIDVTSEQPKEIVGKAATKIPDSFIFKTVELKTTPEHSQDKPHKHYHSMAPQDRRQTCLDLINLHALIENESTSATLIILSMLARVMAIAIKTLPGTPIVHIEHTSNIPSVLKTITEISAGSQRYSGKKKKLRWSVEQPSVITAKTPLGATTPSQDLTDYSFAKIEWKDKTARIPMHYSGQCVAMAPNLPRKVVQQIISESPLLIGFCCGFNLTQHDRPLIKIDGRHLDVVDLDLLRHVDETSTSISAILEAFFDAFFNKKALQKSWAQSIDKFIPLIKSGRFSQKLATAETTILSAALALWKSFLIFASEEKQWISTSEAQDSLMTFWRLVLPESAPKTESAPTSSSAKLQDLNTFLPFLQEYCSSNKDKISSYSDPWTPTTVGMLRKLPNHLLIFPRDQIFSTYLTYVQDAGGDVSLANTTSTNWHTKLQRMLSDNLPFIKTEGRDTTWRYQYFPKEVSDKKIPCLALILEALPNDLKAPDSVFGQLFGEQIPHGVAKDTPNSENEVVSLENTEKAGDSQ